MPVVEYSNLFTKLCTSCKHTVGTQPSRKHLETVHPIKVPEVTYSCQRVLKESEDGRTRLLKLFYMYKGVKNFTETVKCF